MIEYVDHLHEHFLVPVEIRDGHYVAPTAPGMGAQMYPQSLADHLFPTGPVWSS
jgi:L-fuconate dehydratase